MAKRLNGSSGTGKKILQNLEIFRYELKDESINENRCVEYNFNVTFGNNEGIFKIKVNHNGIIDQYSTLDMDNFHRPLGVYNDPSLAKVAEHMINNI